MTTADEKRALLRQQRDHLQSLVDEVDRTRKEFDESVKAEQAKHVGLHRPGCSCGTGERAGDPWRKIEVEITHPMAEHIRGPLDKIIGLMFYELLDGAGNYVAEREQEEQAELVRAHEAETGLYVAECRRLRTALADAGELLRRSEVVIKQVSAQVEHRDGQVAELRETSRVQYDALEGQRKEIERLTAQLDEAFTVIREKEKSAPAPAEPEVCPEGGPGGCASPSSHPTLTDTWAVPRCLRNRWQQAIEAGADQIAELCVSEHCERCNAYRREQGAPELVPNGWLAELPKRSDAPPAALVEALPELVGRSPLLYEQAPPEGTAPAEKSQGEQLAESLDKALEVEDAFKGREHMTVVSPGLMTTYGRADDGGRVTLARHEAGQPSVWFAESGAPEAAATDG